jgi:ribosomal protein S6--L-glutamate ligase
MARCAAPGEFCTNVHLGGRPEPVVLDEETAELAVSAARLVGLDYAGVDLVVPRGDERALVLEVNGTPLFRGLLEATGRDMAEPIVEHVLERVEAR